MKTIKLTVLILLISSCTKSWDCTIETTSSIGTYTHEYTFKGTKSEMKEFEASGNQVAFGVTQVTECQ